jgi:hypothetical protein
LFIERATPDNLIGFLSPTGILDIKTGGNLIYKRNGLRGNKVKMAIGGGKVNQSCRAIKASAPPI